MQNDISTILEKVLTLIEYQKDKNTFVNEFLILCMQHSLADYMRLLSEARKKQLQQILREKDQSKMQEQLEPYVGTEEYSKLLIENIQKLLGDYFKTIMATLTEEQKRKLESYFSELKSSQASTIITV